MPAWGGTRRTAEEVWYRGKGGAARRRMWFPPTPHQTACYGRLSVVRPTHGVGVWVGGRGGHVHREAAGESVPLEKGAATATATCGGGRKRLRRPAWMSAEGGVLRETGWCARAAGSSEGAGVCWECASGDP